MADATLNSQTVPDLSPVSPLEHLGNAPGSSEALTVQINPSDPILQSPTAGESWLDKLVPTLLQPCSHLTIRLPRIIPPATFVTLTTAADLLAKLAEQNQQVQEFRLIATIAPESTDFYAKHNLIPPVLPPDLKELTYIVSATGPSSIGGDTASTPDPYCPELQAAERSLSRDDLHGLCTSGSYTSARKVVDDLTALVYEGAITPKRKPRPMPEYYTPEELEDRLGPPGLARRAKRALVSFAGGFRAPMSERPGRTSRERAQAREFDYRGRPGWSKSGLAERVVWRR